VAGPSVAHPPARSRPKLAYRFRQPITVGRDTPTRSAISVLDTPSAASSTIRARRASPALIEDDHVHAFVARSHGLAG
jgi:hypothetical protein